MCCCIYVNELTNIQYLQPFQSSYEINPHTYNNFFFYKKKTNVSASCAYQIYFELTTTYLKKIKLQYILYTFHLQFMYKFLLHLTHKKQHEKKIKPNFWIGWQRQRENAICILYTNSAIFSQFGGPKKKQLLFLLKTTI